MQVARSFILVSAMWFLATPSLGESLLDRLPKTTCLVLRVEDGERWVEQFESTAIHGVMRSGAFAPLREHLGVASDAGKALQQAGLRSKDIRRLAKGELVLARVDGDGSLPRATATAFQVDFETAKQVFGDMAAAAKRLGASQRSLSKTASDSSFAVELRWPSQRESWIYNYANGVFSVCDSLWLSSQLAAPTNKPLSQSEAFRAVMSRTKSNEDGIQVQWFSRPWELVNDSETKSQFTSQGFEGISAVGGRLCLLDDRTIHRSFVVAKRPLQRAASGLAFVPGGVPELPEWITATSCLATRLDFAKAFQGYGHWFDETHGDGETGLFEMVLEDIRDEPGSPHVDIRKSLVEQLTGPLLSLVVKVPNPDAPEARVFAVQVKDSTVVQQAVAGLLRGDEDVRQIKIGEYPTWKFGDLSQGGTRQVLGPDLSGLCLCLARDCFIVAPREEALRALLTSDRNSQRPVAVSQSLTKQLKTAARQLGVNQSIGLGCSQSLGPIGRLYERVAGLKAQEDARFMTLPELLRIFHIEASEAEVQELRSKLPRVSELAKLFGGSVDSLQETSDGWLVQGIIWKLEK